jgi:hypothetical protein
MKRFVDVQETLSKRSDTKNGDGKFEMHFERFSKRLYNAQDMYFYL